MKDLEARLAAAETRLVEIERIEIEWEDWFNKFRSLYGRLNKREARESERVQTDQAPEPMNPRARALLNPYANGGG